MTATEAGLARGSHVCVVVGDDDELGARAEAFLAEGNARGDKTLAFGPHDSPLLTRLRPLAAVVADPHVAFLGRGALEPEAMFAAFRDQADLAAREGYRGIRVAADMDWLLPARPTADEVVGFELLLDRLVRELDATILCAYRRTSFDRSTVAGALCVHPVRIADEQEPPFTLVAGDGDAWRLSGAVDAFGAARFAGAFAAAARSSCVLDVGGLEFIDVAGMRAIAAAGVPVQLRNAPPSLQRHWLLAGFDRAAPTVRLSD